MTLSEQVRELERKVKELEAENARLRNCRCSRCPRKPCAPCLVWVSPWHQGTYADPYGTYTSDTTTAGTPT